MSSNSPSQLSARQLPLPTPLHTASPQISSLLYDPISGALALRHFDSSFSLYPSFSPLTLPSFPQPKSLIPCPTSSAAFFHLRAAAGPTTTTLFVTSSPLLRPDPSTLLRFHLLRDEQFVRMRVVSTNRDLEFDLAKYGVVFKVNHGVSVKLSGGINVFALHSVSNSKIWVFAVRLVADDLKLMKCAVIDCCFPVFAIRVFSVFLILGEENGVRFFPLQRLVRGHHKKEKKGSGKRISSKMGSNDVIDVPDGDSNLLPVRGEKNSESVKLRSTKPRQDSKDVGAFFVAFKDKGSDGSISAKTTRRRVKAVSIQALSASCFAVLDSDGDVHLLSISYSVQGLDSHCIVKRLTQTMKVVKLAVFHDISAATQNIWTSDGCHSVHVVTISDADSSLDKTDDKESKEKLIQTSVKQAIFTSEKIQDMVPSAASSVLILGQGKQLAYTSEGMMTRHGHSENREVGWLMQNRKSHEDQV